MLRGVFLLVLCVNVGVGAEGDVCVDNGVTGKCVPIKKCLSALQNIVYKKHPQICSFDKVEPTICCVDNEASGPIATTSSIPHTSTTEYIPPTYDYDNSEEKEESKCGPLDPVLTSPKTGRKAWDKCVEYQEKLVYPCKKSTALIGGYERKYECYHNADELIVGGVNASRNEFPHMVLLGFNTTTGISWMCGGSLISEKFILTAGHCVMHKDFGDVKYASIGVLSRGEVTPENTYKVKRSVRHPQYRIDVYNDIAVIELEKEVTLDAFTVPACLHVGDPIDYSRAIAAGWGLLEDRGATPSDVMQKVIVKKIRKVTCQRDYPGDTSAVAAKYDSESQLCYGDRQEKKDTCHGDSGGPLQLKHKKINCMYLVIGVTSGGKGCALRNRPGLYSKVSHYLDWIESIVWP
uniref:Hemocyte protease-2 n=2 Tax=Manduca sexta TaxID=7130 RepID=O44331_MANSE|nr:hemocyte protease-2 [Manduca sexta]